MGGTNSYYIDEGLRRDIVDNLYKSISCSVVRCGSRAAERRHRAVPRPFSFKLTRTPRRPGNGDLKLVSLAAVGSAPPCSGRRGGARLVPPVGAVLGRVSTVRVGTVLDAASTLVPHAIAPDRRSDASAGAKQGSWFVAAGD